MNINVSSKLCAILFFSILSTVQASFNMPLESGHVKPQRHSSHSEIMPEEDVIAFETIHTNADLDDVNDELKFLVEENKALRSALTKSMKTRNCRNVFWAGCHARYSGIIKGAGILFATTGVVLTGVNEIFIQVNHTPLSISGLVLGIVGGCVLAWSDLSKNTAASLDQDIRSSLDIQTQQIGLLKKRKKRLLSEQSYQLKDQLTDMQAGLERLGNSEHASSSDGEQSPSPTDKGKGEKTDVVVNIDQQEKQEVNL